MTADNDALFYVQDLRKGDQDLSLHDDFVYCLTTKKQVRKKGLSPPEGTTRDTLISCSGVCSPRDVELGSNQRQFCSLYERRWKEASGWVLGCYIVLDVDFILHEYKRWFTPNLTSKLRDNIYPLPLGIIRKDITNFTSLREGNKEHFCYANFSLTTDHRAYVAQWADAQKHIKCYFPRRFPKIDKLLDDNLLSDDKLPFDEFLQTLTSYKFCIVPNGVGVDTDRLWECVFMNVVPIVQNNYGNRIFSKIWPMIVVDRYETSDIPKLTTEFEKKYGENIQYNHDLLLRKNLPELLDRIEYECKRFDE